MIGDICNQHGDIEMFKLPTMEGRLGLPIPQALLAIKHGWRWVDAFENAGDEIWITVQRGGEPWKVRR